MSRGVLKSIQTIRFDVGLIHHKSVESPREHEAINDRKPFDEDQRALLLAWSGLGERLQMLIGFAGIIVGVSAC